MATCQIMQMTHPVRLFTIFLKLSPVPQQYQIYDRDHEDSEGRKERWRTDTNGRGGGVEVSQSMISPPRFVTMSNDKWTAQRCKCSLVDMDDNLRLLFYWFLSLVIITSIYALSKLTYLLDSLVVPLLWTARHILTKPSISLLPECCSQHLTATSNWQRQ